MNLFLEQQQFRNTQELLYNQTAWINLISKFNQNSVLTWLMLEINSFAFLGWFYAVLFTCGNVKSHRNKLVFKKMFTL